MEEGSLVERLGAFLGKIKYYIGKYSGRREIGLEGRRQRERDYFVLYFVSTKDI